ncbi:hypothetical protein LIER_20013 [Lithospermum erythrorhizon]|uniref:Uncharacterized protein n=1 Tax=Lithospermum erythrorhizon TaxID=34254 RepID=A0AAV3QLE5_LITER
MLVDTDSSVDILYLSTIDKLHLPRSHLQPAYTTLTGFTCHSVHPVGMDSSYNDIIGRSILTALRAIVSPMHLKLKFSTVRDIGEICRDQRRARICYQTSVPPQKGNLEMGVKRSRQNHSEICIVRNAEEQDNSPKERENLKKPHEEVEIMPFNQANPEKTFHVGTLIDNDHNRIQSMALQRWQHLPPKQ